MKSLIQSSLDDVNEKIRRVGEMKGQRHSSGVDENEKTGSNATIQLQSANRDENDGDVVVEEGDEDISTKRRELTTRFNTLSNITNSQPCLQFPIYHDCKIPQLSSPLALSFFRKYVTPNTMLESHEISLGMTIHCILSELKL